jgi:hypothetical protein
MLVIATVLGLSLPEITVVSTLVIPAVALAGILLLLFGK